MDREVAVIGGGIGGLTAALALINRGIPCTVHERAPALHEIGAGLGVWPAPLAVYDELGIGDEVRALAGPWVNAGLRRSDGRYLIRYTVEQFAARLGEPTIGVHRGELQAVLLRALPAGTLRTGAACVGVADRDSHVTASFDDGSEVDAAAVVGADGRRSLVRAELFGARDLHDCRAVGWRGTARPSPGTDWHEFAGETWGPGGRFGVLPISGGRVTWYAAAKRFRSGGGLDEVLERFGSWHHPIPELIEATPPDQVWRDAMDDLRPMRRWGKGRITLLGDAAHPMTPDLGQGACQAVLDAWVLAEEVAGTGAVESALRLYERRRRRRAALVTRIARMSTSGARPESRAAVALRSRMASLVPARLALAPLAFVTAGPVPTRARMPERTR